MYEIRTPYLNIHNDHISIYVQKLKNVLFRLTDAGETLSELRMIGFDYQTRHRSYILNKTILGFGISLQEDEICINFSNEADFPLKKHRLIQAILSIYDLSYLSKEKVRNVFSDDVANWLDEKDIRYTPSTYFAGAGNLQHKFDFVIPKSKKQQRKNIKNIF